MSKYSEKVAARRIQAQIDLAVRITDGGQPAPAPQAPKRPKTPPPEQRGILVDLGAMPENCAAAYREAADALDRAAAIARAMLERTHRSAQSGEATSAALLAETIAPRLRAAAVRLSRMPSKPKTQTQP
jgi:hypothetical protein